MAQEVIEAVSDQQSAKSPMAKMCGLNADCIGAQKQADNPSPYADLNSSQLRLWAHQSTERLRNRRCQVTSGTERFDKSRL